MADGREAGPRDDVRSGIVEAAARLLREQGARAVTTRGVAQAAGVQAPTIYRLFGDKDGLIDAVAEHVMATYVAAKSTVAGRPTIRWRTCAPAGELHVEFGLANPELFALLHRPAAATRSPATAAGIEVLRARVRRLAAAGLLRVDEERALADDPRRRHRDRAHAAGHARRRTATPACPTRCSTPSLRQHPHRPLRRPRHRRQHGRRHLRDRGARPARRSPTPSARCWPSGSAAHSPTCGAPEWTRMTCPASRWATSSTSWPRGCRPRAPARSPRSRRRCPPPWWR